MTRSDFRRLLRPCLGVLFFGLVKELTKRILPLIADPDDETLLLFVDDLATKLFGASNGPGVQALMCLADHWVDHPDGASFDMCLDSGAIAFLREVGFGVKFRSKDSAGREWYTVRRDSETLRQTWGGPAVDRVFAGYVLQAASEQRHLFVYPPKKRRSRHV